MKGLHHPNIVLFMDSCSKPPTLFVAFNMAKGLTYLHNHNPIVIHRDLKSQNILLDDRMNFGLFNFRDVGKTMSIFGSSLEWLLKC
ncbi:hypothetical protein F443_05197 [Phytophthora nicotianae P1569]|uniref:Protein kinase domain-containing protein n=1 Tax=Phytophthora nicotianae P1569 TaxID=1317065 RepID=V9FKY2_PHYNI|nr:hypothetical protein F443_05197 [Phytophthora nicotianae P1569]